MLVNIYSARAPAAVSATRIVLAPRLRSNQTRFRIETLNESQPCRFSFLRARDLWSARRIRAQTKSPFSSTRWRSSGFLLAGACLCPRSPTDGCRGNKTRRGGFYIPRSCGLCVFSGAVSFRVGRADDLRALCGHRDRPDVCRTRRT